MPRARVKRRLEKFCDRILHTRLDKQAALDIKRQINEYCQRNNVTVEERQVFITTGAGDTLEMICAIPD